MPLIKYIIVGLGNPGPEYHGTRHNAGAALVEELSKRHHLPLNRSKYKSFIGQGQIAGCECVLALPQTYMNLSGQAVRRMLTYTGTPPSRLLIVHDDLDLSPGRIKLRIGGGTGGHRGIESIVGSLQSTAFIRLKIGIGRPPPDRQPEAFVLGRFTVRERELVAAAQTRAVCAVETLVVDGPAKAMSIFNTNLPPEAGADRCGDAS